MTGFHGSCPDAASDTPIFHALTRGGWIPRQHEPAAADRVPRRATDPVTDFERDPLSAPIPERSAVEPPIRVLRRAERMLRAPFTSGLPTLPFAAHLPQPIEPARPTRRGRHRQGVPVPPGGYRLHISPD